MVSLHYIQRKIDQGFLANQNALTDSNVHFLGRVERDVELVEEALIACSSSNMASRRDPA